MLIASLVHASEYAYQDGNYAEAELLFKKSWEEEGKIKDFKFYLKSLIKQTKYEKALEIIQLSRISDKEVTYLKNYCHLALKDFTNVQEKLTNPELIDYVNVKKGNKVRSLNDVSRLLNKEEFDSIESPFYKLYYLLKEQDISGINSFVQSNYKDLRNAKKENQWLVLLETYFYLKSNDQVIAKDLEDFIIYNCKIPDIRKRVQGTYHTEDKFAEFAKKNYQSFSNINSFAELIRLSEEGKISENDLNELIKLNAANKENLCFIKAGIDRDPIQFYELYKIIEFPIFRKKITKFRLFILYLISYTFDLNR